MLFLNKILNIKVQNLINNFLLMPKIMLIRASVLIKHDKAWLVNL